MIAQDLPRVTRITHVMACRWRKMRARCNRSRLESYRVFDDAYRACPIDQGNIEPDLAVLPGGHIGKRPPGSLERDLPGAGGEHDPEDVGPRLNGGPCVPGVRDAAYLDASVHVYPVTSPRAWHRQQSRSP